jgi:Ca2+-binding RTX toxin-like protein
MSWRRTGWRGWARASIDRLGNDNLNAAAGNDLVTGGAGNDTLNGGAGNDLFRYAPERSGPTSSMASMPMPLVVRT